MPPLRYARSELRVRLNAAGTRSPARLRRIAGPAAHGRFRVEDGIRERHPAARMLSMNAATSSISRLSSSSASRAATSAASSERFRRRPALSRIARRMASDLLMPVASSCASACRTSGSRRTLIADDIAQAYHVPSYRQACEGTRMQAAPTVLQVLAVLSASCLGTDNRREADGWASGNRRAAPAGRS